ncbi:unnamed protein product [Pleuronectes platessa]|uniref:Uncharacterized protein n=1 Tax=Pleuronectes platessa TaxID=8262 RepID=A0A9N7ZAD4_PLEPL|nr:unnamed protein product [Pleuronectes platessa]
MRSSVRALLIPPQEKTRPNIRLSQQGRTSKIHQWLFKTGRVFALLGHAHTTVSLFLVPLPLLLPGIS